MRFSVQLPTDRVSKGEEFLAGDAVAEMAQAVEAAGFDACFVTDHPFPDDRWLAGGGHHALDPFVALSFAAAATSRLRVQTHVMVLPYRNPFLAAKAAASLDVLSGGRLILGVSAGYLKSEFAALGADFEARNDVADEAIRAIRAAWTDEGVKLSGRGFEARGNTMLPRPRQRPHPPIWVGGNSRRAIRRAVELGDAWVPFPTQPGGARFVRTARMESPDDLRERLAYLRERAEQVGRTRPLEVALVPFGLDMFTRGAFDAPRFLEGAERLAELGVSWLTVSLPSRTRAEYCSEAERFGQEIIEKLRDR
ncbi:MAG: LLM class F420-dependent oxidoreductase [Myxococcota bacterium]